MGRPFTYLPCGIEKEYTITIARTVRLGVNCVALDSTLTAKGNKSQEEVAKGA
jgi:hypothetical protein